MARFDMFLKAKGQKTGEIVNPYHGMMMLHCGDKVTWDKAPG